MAAAPLIMAGVSTAVGMAGSANQAAGAQAAAGYNAAVKEQQATAAVAQSAEDERRLRISSRSQLGGIRNAIGASGIQTEGSALEVLQSSASNAELDALTVRHQGQMKAWAYRAGANLDLFQGEQAKTQGDFAATGYLLKGLSSAAGSFGGGGGGGGGGGESMMAGEGSVGAGAIA